MENNNHVTHRTCTKCGKTLPIQEFVRINRERSWFRKVCRKCTNQRIRDWWRRNPEWAQARSKRNYEARREVLLSPAMRGKINERVRERVIWLREQVYKGYGARCQCPKCPEINVKFLTVDHVQNDGHLERTRGVGKRRGGQGHDLYRRLIREGFPKTFQLLCFNCNLGKARNGGVCPHNDGMVAT